MADVKLYSGAASPNDVVLRDPNAVAATGAATQAVTVVAAQAIEIFNARAAATQATAASSDVGIEKFNAAIAVAQATTSTSVAGLESFQAAGAAIQPVTANVAIGTVVNPAQPQSFGGKRRAVTWYPQRVRHVGIPSWPTRHGKAAADQGRVTVSAAGSVRQKFVAVAASRQGTVTGGPRGVAIGAVLDETEEAYLLGLLELEDAAA